MNEEEMNVPFDVLRLLSGSMVFASSSANPRFSSLSTKSLYFNSLGRGQAVWDRPDAPPKKAIINDLDPLPKRRAFHVD